MDLLNESTNDEINRDYEFNPHESVNHYNFSENYIEHHSYGISPKKAVKNLVLNLKFQNLYFYHVHGICDEHKCKHICVSLQESVKSPNIHYNYSLITFQFRNEVWRASVRIPK